MHYNIPKCITKDRQIDHHWVQFTHVRLGECVYKVLRRPDKHSHSYFGINNEYPTTYQNPFFCDVRVAQLKV